MGDTYLAINFKVSPISGRDILIAELSYLSFEMFEEKIEGVIAYIKKSAYKDGILNNVRIFNSNEFKISYKIQEIQNKNWNEQWEQNFDPVDINENCIIRAPFHKPSNKLYDIIIKPEMSFGTGHHETTKLMLEFIYEEELENKTLCDVGCGTGVLSILSEKKGVKKIDAIDIDINSYNNTLDNIERNSCKKINTIHASSEMILGNKYDIILSNITLNGLVENFENFNSISKANTILILSGFYKDDLNYISELLTKFKFEFTDYKMKNDWVAARYYRN
tara:strand:- start:644 stop:1477 length:834 start_codon:yes stop_codon:yes gene_type:complete